MTEKKERHVQSIKEGLLVLKIQCSYEMQLQGIKHSISGLKKEMFNTTTWGSVQLHDENHKPFVPFILNKDSLKTSLKMEKEVKGKLISTMSGMQNLDHESKLKYLVLFCRKRNNPKMREIRSVNTWMGKKSLQMFIMHWTLRLST